MIDLNKYDLLYKYLHLPDFDHNQKTALVKACMIHNLNGSQIKLIYKKDCCWLKMHYGIYLMKYGITVKDFNFFYQTVNTHKLGHVVSLLKYKIKLKQVKFLFHDENLTYAQINEGLKGFVSGLSRKEMKEIYQVSNTWKIIRLARRDTIKKKSLFKYIKMRWRELIGKEYCLPTDGPALSTLFT